jgi:hypothetical protein
MNYSEFKLDENENNLDLSKITSNDAQGILEDFEILNKNLDEYKKKIEDLQAHKIYFDNYISNLQNNHLNIMNIINDYDIQGNNNELNELFINYNNKMKINYDKWIIQNYTVKLLEFENTIDIIEKKIIEFRTLFIYIINKITKPQLDNKKLCPICFENEVDICLNPCGHTLCNKCVISNRSRYTNEKCYSCRGVIHDHIKIFFSL